MTTSSRLPSLRAAGRSLLPCVLLLAAAPVGAATLSMTTIATYSVGTGVYDVKSADLNGDGQPDLVAAAYNGNRLWIRFNDGQGGFAGGQDFTGGAPCAIDLADYDGDGKIDIAVADWDNQRVDVYRNQGGGAFVPSQQFPIGQNARDIVSADFDGDGRRDLAVAAFQNTVWLFKGTPAGFAAPTTIVLAGGYKAIAAADLDGDGRPDLGLCDSVNGRVRLLHNAGAMSFTQLPSLTTGSGPSDLVFADFDGDGDQDLAETNENGGASTFRNNGSGNLIDGVNYPIGHFSQSVGCADIDGDGKLDLLFTNYTESTVEVLPGAGDGLFGTGQIGAISGGPRCAVVIDVDGDGKPEIATGDQGGGVRILAVRQALVFGGGDAYSTNVGCYEVAVADLDGDHKPEILSALANFGGTALLRNDAAGHFPTRTTVLGGSPIAYAVLDADHDGDPDLLTANWYEGTVSYRHGAAGATFDAPVDYAMGTNPRDVVVADFDGDGELDMATASHQAVWFRRGLGSGVFGPASSFPVGNTNKGIAAGDVTGDGRPDVVVVDGATNAVVVLRNAGPMAFQRLPDIVIDQGPSSIALGDLDGDGDLDVVVATEASRLDVVQNLGGGTWATRRQVTIGGFAESVVLADFNGDGRPEALTSSFANTGLMQVFTFAPSLVPIEVASMESGGGTRWAAAGDVNGDGLMDVVSGEDPGATVHVFIQGAVTPPQPPPPPPPTACAGLRLALPTAPTQIVAVDLDGDGVRDLAASSESGYACFLKGLPDNPSGPRQDFAVGAGAQSLAAADVDGDGILELAVTESLGHTLAIFRRTGGAFADIAHVDVGERPRFVLAADLDRDGRADFVTANDPPFGPGSITILFNRAGATWHPEVEPIGGETPPDPAPVTPGGGGGGGGSDPASRIDLPLPAGATRLVAADFDLDGELDLAAVLHTGPVVVLMAMGGGRFHAAQVLPWTGTGLATGDFDQDGRPDLAIADYANDLVRLVYDTAANPWTTTATIPTEDGPTAVSAFDVNGDQLKDLAYVGVTGVFGTRLATGANTFRNFGACTAGSDVRDVTFAPRADGGVDAYVLSRGDATALLRQYPSGFFARTIATTGATPALGVAFGLEPARPNPAAGANTIAFGLPADAKATLTLYDVRGRVVKVLVDGVLPAGRHEATWDGRDASGARARAGVYFYRLVSTAGTRVERLVLLGGGS